MYPNNEAGRKAYDRHQMSSLPTLLPGLDPDPPVQLCARTRPYDATILAQLRQQGWPGTGQSNTGARTNRPKAIKAITLARKIAKGSGLSDVEIRVLADRIAWLIRNPFRWKARDGYAVLAVAKGSPADGNTSDESSRPVWPEATPQVDSEARNALEFSSPNEQNSVTEQATVTPLEKPQSTKSRMITTGPETKKSRVSRDDNDLFEHSSGLDSSDDLLAELGGSANMSWEDYANQVGLSDEADDDRGSSTKLCVIRTVMIEHLPQKKARALLLAIEQEEPEEVLRLKANALLADEEELSAALSSSSSLAQDIDDACAALGIDLPC